MRFPWIERRLGFQSEQRDGAGWRWNRVAATGLAAWWLLAGCSDSKNIPQSKSATPPSLNNYFGTDGSGGYVISIDAATSGIAGTTGGATYVRSGGFLQYKLSSNYPYYYALEVPNQAALELTGLGTGSLIVAAAVPSCPVLKGTVEYEFLALQNRSPAYGTFVASTNGDGSKWTFSGAQQHQLGGGDPGPLNGFGFSAAGTCEETASGYVVNVAATLAYETSETLAIGPTGFMVDDQEGPQPRAPLAGFAVPFSPVDGTNLVEAGFLGFMTEVDGLGNRTNTPVVFNQKGPGPTQSIEGAAFTENAQGLVQPVANNMSLTLGPEDGKINGLFPAASVTLPDPSKRCTKGGVASTDALGNPQCTSPAVAIAGAPGGKFALYLAAVDLSGFNGGNGLEIYLYQQ